MTAIRDEIMAKFHRQNDPWSGLTGDGGPAQIQGWNSNHPWLRQAVAEEPRWPQIVVEIGVWKGASVANMADEMRRQGINGVVIAVDTWLGSSEHWWFDHLAPELPGLYHEFLTNIAKAGLIEYVVPLRLDSLNAARLMRLHQIQADVIHLDAGHDYGSVFGDLNEWWPLLKPGGLYLGDDYHVDGSHFLEVKVATDHFLTAAGHLPSLQASNGKCRVRKSGVDEPIRQP